MSIRWASIKVKNTVVAAWDIFSNIYNGDSQQISSDRKANVQETTDNFDGRHDSATRDEHKLDGVCDLHRNDMHEKQDVLDLEGSQTCYEDKDEGLGHDEKPEDRGHQSMEGSASSTAVDDSVTVGDLTVKSTGTDSAVLGVRRGLRRHWITASEAAKGRFAPPPVSDPLTTLRDLFNHHKNVGSTTDSADKSSVSPMTAPAIEPAAWSRSSNPASGMHWADVIHTEGALSDLDIGSPAMSLSNASVEAVADTDEDMVEDDDFGTPLKRQSDDVDQASHALDSWPEDLSTAVVVQDLPVESLLPGDDPEGMSKHHQAFDVKRWLGYTHVSFASSPKNEATGGLQLDNDGLSNVPLGGLPTEKQVEIDELLARQLETELNGAADEESDEEFPMRHRSPTNSLGRRAQDVVVHNAEERAGSWSVEENSWSDDWSEESSKTSFSEQDGRRKSNDHHKPKTSASFRAQGSGHRLVHTYRDAGDMMNIWDIHKTGTYERIKPDPNTTVYPTTEGVEIPSSEFSREAFLKSSSLTSESHSNVRRTPEQIKPSTSQDDVEQTPPEPDLFGDQERVLARTEYSSSQEDRSSEDADIDEAISFDTALRPVEQDPATHVETAEELAQTQYSSRHEGSSRSQDAEIDEAVSFDVALPRVEHVSATHVKSAEQDRAFSFDGHAEDVPSASPMGRDSARHGFLSDNWTGVPKWSHEEYNGITDAWMTESRPFSSMTLGERVRWNRKSNPFYGEAEAREDEKREFIEKFSPFRTRALGIYVDGAVTDEEDEYGLAQLRWLNERYKRFLDKDACTPPTNEMSARIRVTGMRATPVHIIEDDGRNGSDSSDATARGEERSDGRMAEDGTRGKMLSRVSSNGKGKQDVFSGIRR